MSKTAGNNRIKRIIDIAMCILLLCLMAFQVTGDKAHEWIGISMTVLVIVHQILNRRWYGVLLRGKYNPYRTLTAIVNCLLVISFALTAFCGMSMSTWAVAFLYGMAPASFVRVTHLSLSHWSFLLMGVHLGLHIPALCAFLKRRNRIWSTAMRCAFLCAGGIGLYLFVTNRMFDYLFFRVHFAFLDYEKAAWLVFGENVLMLMFWVLAGTVCAELCTRRAQKTAENRTLHPLLSLGAAVCIGVIALMAFPQKETPVSFEPVMPQETPSASEIPEEELSDQTDPSLIEDGFVLIKEGTFLMGSPETENWRIEDETLHEVSVSSFYIDPYETTQAEYEWLMGQNPSSFSGENLPAESISWLDAVQYANAKSQQEGLALAYEIHDGEIIWNLSSNGYRLPTEAEWEYACRAGTLTPFNTEKSLSADEANFYGHYPYEIEENYFNSSVLDAKPGEYRQTTVSVGSFEANAWGLYDMHGNVNEWCWDYYGPYDLSVTENPAGASNGTRHVYRGGGWNDFAKNMRSAYRAAAQEDLRSFNLGVRLVRNADQNRSGQISTKENTQNRETGGKVLIAYFSWGGNTRGIAREIQEQTGADLFEITPVNPYSTDYNTVLMQAQEDQHRQARPELSEHVQNFDQYDVILLGYPNWWASIPMPIAAFLEEYDFSEKTIIPFCSHGGGRFGQSLTAIAKLAPDAAMKEGLSVHYSGGTQLPDDVSQWLSNSGLK